MPTRYNPNASVRLFTPRFKPDHRGWSVALDNTRELRKAHPRRWVEIITQSQQLTYHEIRQKLNQRYLYVEVKHLLGREIHLFQVIKFYPAQRLVLLHYYKTNRPIRRTTNGKRPS